MAKELARPHLLTGFRNLRNPGLLPRMESRLLENSRSSGDDDALQWEIFSLVFNCKGLRGLRIPRQLSGNEHSAGLAYVKSRQFLYFLFLT